METLAHRREGLGLALFVRRGMAAWMRAWSQCAPPTEPGSRAASGDDETVPADLRSQIATLLAGMILCIQQEGTS